MESFLDAKTCSIFNVGSSMSYHFCSTRLRGPDADEGLSHLSINLYILSQAPAVSCFTLTVFTYLKKLIAYFPS